MKGQRKVKQHRRRKIRQAVRAARGGRLAEENSYRAGDEGALDWRRRFLVKLCHGDVAGDVADKHVPTIAQLVKDYDADVNAGLAPPPALRSPPLPRPRTTLPPLSNPRHPVARRPVPRRHRLPQRPRVLPPRFLPGHSPSLRRLSPRPPRFLFARGGGQALAGILRAIDPRRFVGMSRLRRALRRSLRRVAREAGGQEGERHHAATLRPLRGGKTQIPPRLVRAELLVQRSPRRTRRL